MIHSQVFQKDCNHSCCSFENFNHVKAVFFPHECFDRVLEIETNRNVRPHSCLSFPSLSLSLSVLFRLIQSLPPPGKWQHSRGDSLKSHFDGRRGLFLPLTTVVKLWPRGHFGGALSAPAKCGEPDGRTKKMICGQSITVVVLKLCDCWADWGDGIKSRKGSPFNLIGV